MSSEFWKKGTGGGDGGGDGGGGEGGGDGGIGAYSTEPAGQYLGGSVGQAMHVELSIAPKVLL